MAVLWRTGLDLRELLELTGDHVRLEDDLPVELVWPSAVGSTTEARKLALDAMAQEELGRWLDVRRQVLGARRVNLTASSLFCALSADRLGEPIPISQVRLTVSRLGKRAALQHAVRPAASRRTQSVARRAAVRSLRSDLTPDGTVLHEIVDRAVNDALDIHRPCEGLEGLLDLGVVLDVLETRLVEELKADQIEVVENSTALDLWRKLSAR